MTGADEGRLGAGETDSLRAGSLLAVDGFFLAVGDLLLAASPRTASGTAWEEAWEEAWSSTMAVIFFDAVAAADLQERPLGATAGGGEVLDFAVLLSCFDAFVVGEASMAGAGFLNFLPRPGLGLRASSAQGASLGILSALALAVASACSLNSPSSKSSSASNEVDGTASGGAMPPSSGATASAGPACSRSSSVVGFCPRQLGG